MLLTTIQRTLSKTAEITGEPPELVAKVMSDYFKQLKQFLKNPTHVGVRIDYIGSFQLNYPGILTYLRKNLRKDFKEEYRVYWKLRHKAKEYGKSRKFKNYRESYVTRQSRANTASRAERSDI